MLASLKKKPLLCGFGCCGIESVAQQYQPKRAKPQLFCGQSFGSKESYYASNCDPMIPGSKKVKIEMVDRTNTNTTNFILKQQQPTLAARQVKMEKHLHHHYEAVHSTEVGSQWLSQHSTCHLLPCYACRQKVQKSVSFCSIETLEFDNTKSASEVREHWKDDSQILKGSHGNFEDASSTAESDLTQTTAESVCNQSTANETSVAKTDTEEESATFDENAEGKVNGVGSRTRSTARKRSSDLADPKNATHLSKGSVRVFTQIGRHQPPAPKSKLDTGLHDWQNRKRAATPQKHRTRVPLHTAKSLAVQEYRQKFLESLTKENESDLVKKDTGTPTSFETRTFRAVPGYTRRLKTIARPPTRVAA